MARRNADITELINNVNPCCEMPLRFQEERTLNALTNFYGIGILTHSGKSNKQIKGGINMFKENDLIIVMDAEYPKLLGVTGKVVEVIDANDEGTTYGVILDTNVYGHDLDGKCEFGFGWYFKQSEIEIENKSKLCRLVVKNETMILDLKSGKEMFIKGTIYKIRKNGALTFLTCDCRKIFVYKDGATSPMLIKVINEDDRVVTLHLMESMRIMPYATINTSFVLVIYNQEESDKLEIQLFPPVQVVDVTTPVDDTQVAKTYTSEEELYAELGITRK